MCKELIVELLDKLVDNEDFVSYLESKNLILKRSSFSQSIKIPVLKVNFINLDEAINRYYWKNGIYFVGVKEYFNNYDVNTFDFSFIPDEYLVKVDDETTKNILINKGIGFVDENFKVFKPKAIFNGKPIHLSEIYTLLVCILNERNIDLAIKYLKDNHYITDIKINNIENTYFYSINRDTRQINQFMFNDEGKDIFIRSFMEKYVEHSITIK